MHPMRHPNEQKAIEHDTPNKDYGLSLWIKEHVFVDIHSFSLLPYFHFIVVVVVMIKILAFYIQPIT